MLLGEGKRLVRRQAHVFEKLTLDPDQATAYLAAYPEALERMTFSTSKPLKEAIVDAVEQVILDQVFDQDHKAIILQQWESTRAEEIVAFVAEAAAKYKKLTGRDINFRDVIETERDLDALAAAVFEVYEGFNDDNMDYEYMEEARRAVEYMEFLGFVKSGDISMDAVIGNDTALAMTR